MAINILAITTKFDFVFLDESGRPFYCYDWEGEKWLFYWSQDHWTSLRKVTDQDIFPLNLSDSDQQMYFDLHTKYEQSQRDYLKTQIHK